MAQSEGKLEYHIPAQFTKDRPAVNVTHVKHDMPISQHPLASQIPRPTGTIQTLLDVRKFRPLFVSEHSPTELKHWIYTEHAQLHLHIVSFADATLVTLTWLHTLLDGMGRNMLLRCWTAMLEGREQDIPEFYGYDFDPLARLGALTDSKLKEDADVEEEEYILKEKTVSGWKMFRFVLGYMWELLVYRKEQIGVVVLPSSMFKRIRAEALYDLSSMHPATIVMDTSDPSNPKPFLSDGDILCAWWTRLIISSQPWLASAKPTKTIQIMNVFGMRNLLTDTQPQLLPKGVAYISNCVTAICSFFSLSEFLSLPLGRVAARIRADLVQQSTRPQVEANMRLTKAGYAKSGHAPLYGDADMVFSAFSNWTKGKMFETDFRAAVIKEADVEHSVGRPSYIQADGTAKGFSVRNSGPCIGKDWKGDWWVGASLRPEAWRNLARAVEGMK